MNDNKELIESAYANFLRGNISAILETLDPNVEWVIPGPSDVELCRTWRGRDGVGTFFQRLDALQEALSFEPSSFIAEDDRVICLGNWRWRIKETGRVAASDFAHVFTMRDGKVARFQEFADTAALAEAYRPVAVAS